jgi:hypothetical protein
MTSSASLLRRSLREAWQESLAIVAATPLLQAWTWTIHLRSETIDPPALAYPHPPCQTTLLASRASIRPLGLALSPEAMIDVLSTTGFQEVRERPLTQDTGG